MIRALSARLIASSSMSIVNDRITSLADLEDVDSAISDIQQLKSRIQSIVEQKLADLPDGEADKARHESAKEAVILIKNLLEVEPEDALTSLSVISERYGQLNTISSMKPLLSRKHELKGNQAFLLQAETIENSTAELDIPECLGKIKSIMEESSPMVPESLKEQTYLHLTKLLHQKANKERETLEASLSSNLKKVDWLSAKDTKQFNTTSIMHDFNQLIELQANTEGLGVPQYPETWWGLQVLLEPIVSRFKFHFDSPNKDTNKLSKPEWALEYIENFLKDNLDVVLVLIGDTFEKFDLIATFEVISTLLQPIRDKFANMMATINQNVVAYEHEHTNLERTGRILSHLIYELSAFDQRLKNIYYYNPHATLKEQDLEPWLGLTYDLLFPKEVNSETPGANNWIQFELNLATKRFQSEIIEPENSFHIDIDFLSSQQSNGIQLKPTYSAYNLTQLFENLTSHYRTLNILKYQLKYISNIQLKLIDLYANEIKQRLDQFSRSFALKMSLNFLSKGLNRTSDKEQVSSETSVANILKGLQILTELYCLAKYIRTHLQQWGDEVFFVELHQAYRSVAPTAEYSETLFDSAVRDYDQLLEQILNKNEELFKKEIRTSLKSYVNSSQWNQPIKEADLIFEPSGELSMIATNLPVYLNYIQRCVSNSDYYVIVDKIVSLLSIILREYVITNNQFNSLGVKQLQVDVGFLTSRLANLLLLDPTALTYTTSLNKDFLRIQDSVKFLNTVNAETAIKYKRQYDRIGELRKSFDNNLCNLSDHSISDLIVRIV